MNGTVLTPHVTLLVVDDSESFRNRVRRLLCDDEALEIVGESANGQEALRDLSRLRPDVMLLDLHMPVLDGFSVLRSVKEDFPATKVIVMTNDPSAITVQRCAVLLADAVIDKANTSIVVIPTVRRVAASIDRRMA